MAVERGLAEYFLYRGDRENYFMEFFTTPNEDLTDQTAVNLSTTYDEIYLDIRTLPNQDSRRIIRKSLTNGDFVIGGAGSNEITFNLKTDEKGGPYYFDMRFRLSGTQSWLTLISGTVLITDNVTKL